jgi:fatty-acyl-CoA synthase
MLSYVFTSGTTGLPKACKITHLREAEGGIFFSRINGVVAEDRIFSPIGLHHSAGSLPLAMCLVTGATLVLSKSFSASGTIPACRESGATVLVYIGEMLRYIANSPVTPDDRNHSLRMLLGNGLRPDVWDRFVDRFGIEPSGVREYYSSTEGTITLVNVRGKPHAVGYLPPWASLVYRVPIIEVVDQNDDDGGRILGSSGGMLQPRRRGSDHLCIECTTGRVGEMLGPIDPSDPAAQFEGYAGNESATNSKIIHSVFRNGDTWFRSGDFLRRDANGFYFFCDRAGDTFRWRGENVATAEVEQTALRCPIVADCVCYGVATPHNDGKAGMLAVVFSSGTCGVEAAVSKLHDALAKDLPSYAVPTFLRVCVEIPTTPGTHKHQKATLVEQGFDPGKAPTESLFVRRGRGNTPRYEPLSHAEHALIVRGETRL